MPGEELRMNEGIPPVEIVIAGIGGRMGSEVARAVRTEGSMALLGGLEALGHSLVGGEWSDGGGAVRYP